VCKGHSVSSVAGPKGNTEYIQLLPNIAAPERRNSDEANVEPQLEPNRFYNTGQASVTPVIHMEKWRAFLYSFFCRMLLAKHPLCNVLVTFSWR